MAKDDPPKSDLPLKFRIFLIGALAATLIAHIFIDAFRDGYDGAATSLMLGGVVGGALGLNEWFRSKDD